MPKRTRKNILCFELACARHLCRFKGYCGLAVSGHYAAFRPMRVVKRHKCRAPAEGLVRFRCHALQFGF